MSLGFVLYYQKRDSLALIYLKKANVNTLALGLRPISNIYIDYGRADSAFYYAEKLRSLEPLAGAYSQLAVIKMMLGDLRTARPFVTQGVSVGGTPSSRDIVKHTAIEFYIRMGEYSNALKIIHDNFSDIKDEAFQKRVASFLFRIYFAQKNWTAFEALLNASTNDWRALMNRERKQAEFNLTISKLAGKDSKNQNYALLKGDYKTIVAGLKKLTPAQRFTSYQRWVWDPFASGFVKTSEFKELFVGYQSWVQEMETNIKRMGN